MQWAEREFKACSALHSLPSTALTPSKVPGRSQQHPLPPWGIAHVPPERLTRPPAPVPPPKRRLRFRSPPQAHTHKAGASASGHSVPPHEFRDLSKYKEYTK